MIQGAAAVCMSKGTGPAKKGMQCAPAHTHCMCGCGKTTRPDAVHSACIHANTQEDMGQCTLLWQLLAATGSARFPLAAIQPR